MLSKSLIQFSVEGQGCVPSLLFDLRPNYGGGNEGNGDLLQKVPCRHCYTLCPQPCSQPHTSPPETPGHSWASLGQSLVGSLLLYLGPWYAQGSVCALPESVSPALCKFWQLCGGLMATSSQRAYAIPRSTAPRAQPTADPHLPRGHPNTLCFSPYGVSVLVCTRYV